MRDTLQASMYFSLLYKTNVFNFYQCNNYKTSQFIRMTLKRNPNSYSIWFIPTDKKFLLLEKKIIEISQSFEDIKFIPHVTLISNLDYSQKFLSKKIKRIAKKIPAFKIFLGEVDYSDEFFQSFFINVKLNDQLIYARKIALLNFPEISQNYNPHLSLAYGYMNDKMKENLKKKVRCPIKYFTAKDLYLAYNDEIKFKWKIIDKFELKND